MNENRDSGLQKERIVDLEAVCNRFLPPGLPSARGQVTQNGFVRHTKEKKGARGADKESFLG